MKANPRIYVWGACDNVFSREEKLLRYQLKTLYEQNSVGLTKLSPDGSISIAVSKNVSKHATIIAVELGPTSVAAEYDKALLN